MSDPHPGYNMERAAQTLNDLCTVIHTNNAIVGWWTDKRSGMHFACSYHGHSPLMPTRNAGEMIALIHSEVSEALEGVRKDAMDDHLPHRKSEEVEMADAVIRILDYCGGRGLDLGGALIEKLAFNAQRADHKMENRNKPGGKSI